MKTSGWLRALLLGMGSLLAGCGEKTEETVRRWLVDFAQPFPAMRKDLAAFPQRHWGVYTAADSSKSLCIGRTAVWRQELKSSLISRQELAAQGQRLLADSTYQEDGTLHYLHWIARDTVRDSWLACDTIFDCAKPATSRLRYYQGNYYLNTALDSTDQWQVERLEISGRHLRWQTLGQDTLRIRALAPGSIRHEGSYLFQLVPASVVEARHVSQYAGLWETTREYDRRH